MKKYAVISNKKRNQLVTRVAQNGESVSRVAKELRMKLSSAKSILRTYKKSGRIFDKKRIINRGIRTKKQDLFETEQNASKENMKIQKVESQVKFETLEKGEEDSQKKHQLAKKEQSFSPKTEMLQNPIDQVLKYQFYLQLCLNQQLSYYNNILNYYKIPEFQSIQN